MSAGNFPRRCQLPSPKEPLAAKQRKLHASEQSLGTVFDAAYWRAICPKLHVNDGAFQKAATKGGALDLGHAVTEDLRAQIDREGVSQVMLGRLLRILCPYMPGGGTGFGGGCDSGPAG